MDRILLKPTEAADLLGISRSKTYELIGKGDIPSVRWAGGLRVPKEALEARIRQAVEDQAGQ